MPTWGRRFAAELCSASAKRAKPASEPGLVLQLLEAPPVTRIGGAFLCGSVEDARGDLPLIATLLFL
jgi:hypothetical protein